MRKRFLSSLFAFVILAVSPLSFADQMTHKQDSCLTCHTAGTSSAFPGPQLGGLSKEYIHQQLLNFKHGYRTGDQKAAVMKTVAEGLTDDQVVALSKWASKLESKPIFDYSKAENTVGYQVFEAKCQGCHSSFMGRFMTDSPRLDGLDSQYIISQLTQFSNDARTIAEPSKHQAKMVATVKSLTAEEMTALNAFIKQAGS